jgi:cytochrome c556
MKISRVLIIGFFLSMVGLGLASHASEDDRELVKLPPMMQEHMLANMRDHLIAIEEILGELASGNVDEASAIAENRLGMSSLSLHGAEHLGKFMPEAMGAIGTQMHRAASRFSIVAQDAELNAGKTPQRKVYKALQEITENCNACHRAYRIR